MVARQAARQLAGVPGHTRLADTLQRHLFHVDVGGQRDQATQAFRLFGRVQQADAAAIGMADGHVVTIGNRLRQYLRQFFQCIAMQVVDGARLLLRIGLTMALAVKQQAVAAGGIAQGLRKALPHARAAQALVQEHQHRSAGGLAGISWLQRLGMDAGAVVQKDVVGIHAWRPAARRHCR